MRLWRFAAPVLILLPALPALCQQQEPISLGEVARQNKPTQKAKRVITDDDMPQRTVEPPVASANGESSSSGSSTARAAGPSTAPDAATESKPVGKDTAKTPTGGNPEAEALRARIKELVSDQLGLENVIRDTEAKIETEDDPSRVDILRDMLKNSKSSLERRKAEAADLKARLKTLEKK